MMASALILTGYGTVSANSTITNASHHNSNTQSQTSSKPTHSTEINSQSIKTGGYNLNQSTSQGQCIGKLYSVLGEITKVNQTQSGIQSIQLLVIKSIMPRGSYEPLQQLKSYTIYLDQPKSELGSLQLKHGIYIDVTFSQFIRYSNAKKQTLPANAGWIWGSNFDWVKTPTWENSTSTKSSPKYKSVGGYNFNFKNSISQGELISHIYTVEGMITNVSQSNNVIDSIQLDVMEPIVSVDSEGEPLKLGREYTIYFDQPKSELPSLQLIKGAIIKLSLGQYVRFSDPKKRTLPAHAGWIWGSNFGWVKVLGALSGESYVSAAKAIGAITSLEQSNGQFYPSGPAINLGLGIKAEFSGGAGQYSYKWNEGRWIVLTQFWGGGAGNQVVKDMVAYLHTHMLPAPENKGIILIQQPGSSNNPLKVTKNIIAWQVGEKVHQLRYTGNPIQALQIVVNSSKE